jgi:hypothetical protein
MKFTFIGVPGESHQTIHMYGADMPLGEAVEVSALAARKLANHPHFKAAPVEAEEPAEPVEPQEQEEQPRKKPGRPRKDA